MSPIEYASRVLASTFSSYADVAASYDVNERARAIVTPRVQALADQITADAKTPREVASMLYGWVAKNIRYEYHLNGIGSYSPHTIDHILDNRIGDCKDHVLLLRTLLTAKHIASTSSLINVAPVYHLPELPAIFFDHVILYIPSLQMYVDPTAEFIPFGTLPPDDEGKPTIHTASFHGIEYTPPTDNSKNWEKTFAELTYHEDGSADGTIQTQMGGYYAVFYRHLFAFLQSLPYRDSVVQRIISASGFRGAGKYLFYDDVSIPQSTFRFVLQYHIKNALDLSGASALTFSLPIGGQEVPISHFASTLSRERPEHDFPCSGGSADIEIVEHLPKSVSIMAIPKNVYLRSATRMYLSKYEQSGNTIISHRSIMNLVHPNVCTPTEFDASRPLDLVVGQDLKKQFIFRPREGVVE